MHNPEVIYLQPWCDGCAKHSYDSRQWCEDNVWDRCEDEKCQQKAIKYIRADLVKYRNIISGKGGT